MGRYSSRFLILGQQNPAGVNGWLMIRNPLDEIFTGLSIYRRAVDHGSPPDGGGLVIAISGDIRA
jgi:hypothetical protein